MDSGLARSIRSMSKLLVASYILDVVVIIAFGLISFGFSRAAPSYHPFSLLDLSISYPFKEDTVTTTDLALAAIMAPIIIIALVCLLAVPSPAAARTLPRGSLLWIKLWECFVGLMGLALSLITQFLLVQGLKNIIGKPRPDMLARCNPNLDDIAAHAVGGYGQGISDRWVLVDYTICQQNDMSILHDGFRSFPSGHAATSFSGLLYLTLYLCTKFAVSFPFLCPSVRPSTHADGAGTFNSFHYRDGAASAPIWLLFLIYLPIGGALYICASRYFDYHHHGFDILSGALIGILTSWFAFRWYHVPIGYSAGWSWGPRSRDRAFGVGIGGAGYVDELPSWRDEPAPVDLEMGRDGHHGPLRQSAYSAEETEALRASRET